MRALLSVNSDKQERVKNMKDYAQTRVMLSRETLRENIERRARLLERNMSVIEALELEEFSESEMRDVFKSQSVSFERCFE